MHAKYPRSGLISKTCTSTTVHIYIHIHTNLPVYSDMRVFKPDGYSKVGNECQHVFSLFPLVSIEKKKKTCFASAGEFLCSGKRSLARTFRNYVVNGH